MSSPGYDQLFSCAACGGCIVPSKGCVRIEREPGQTDAYHPECAPSEPWPTHNPRRGGKK